METSFITTDINTLLQQLAPDMQIRGNLIETLKHFAEIARREFASDACIISALHPFTGAVTQTFLVSLTAPVGHVASPQQIQAEDVFPLSIKHDVEVVADLDSMPDSHTPFTRTEHMRASITLVFKTHAGQPLGVLYLAFRQAHQFSGRDFELIHIFSHQASSILQETWLLHRYSEVVRIGQEMNEDLTAIEVLFNKIYCSAAHILDIRDAFLLAIHRPQTNDFDTHLKDDGRDFRIIEHEHHLKGASRHVLDTQEPMIIQHWSAQETQLPFQLAHIPGTSLKESYIFVPLILHGLGLGILSIQHHNVDAYTQDDITILQLLANYIVLAFNNIRLYHSLSQLHETGKLITRHIDAEHTLQATVDKIKEATCADCVSLYPGQSKPDRVLSIPVVAGNLPRTPADEFFMRKLDEIAIAALQYAKPIFAQELLLVENILSTQHPALTDIETDIHSLVVLPLSVDTTAVGVLYVLFRQTQHFDAQQRLLIDGLGHYAAIAISNAQAFSAIVQRRTSELIALQEVDYALNRFLELAPMLNMLLEAACKFVPAQSATVLLHYPREHMLKVMAATGRLENVRYALAAIQQEENGLTWWVMQQKEPLCVGNVHTYPWCELYVAADPQTVSELDVPLLDAGEVIGVLNFESTVADAFSQQDQDFLCTLAGHAVLAIKKAQAYEREKRLAEEQKVMNEINKEIKEIVSQLDPDRVFNLILDKALDLTKSSTGVLMLHDPERHRLWMAAEHGVMPEKKWRSHSVDDGIVGHVFGTKRKLNVDPSQEPWRDVYLNYIAGTRSELAVPIMTGETVRGVLNIESAERHKFDIHDEILLEALADLAVVALQNAELYEKAAKEAQHFDLMYRVSRQLSELTEIEQIDHAYDIIFQHAEQYRHSRVILRRYNGLEQCLGLLRASQFSEPPIEKLALHEGINGLVTRERQTEVISDITQPASEGLTATIADPTIRSIVVAPIQTKERFYGTLGLYHSEVKYFQKTDIQFVDSLAQQLANTIYRLETIQAQKESEQQANAALEVSIIGQSAMELTHRLGNELGLVETYVGTIQRELKSLAIENDVVEKKLENVSHAVRTVLNLSRGLKDILTKSNEAVQEERVIISPTQLFASIQSALSLPPTIQLKIEVDETIAPVCVFRKLVDDILLNLINNAIDAMANGGTLTLSAYTSGYQVALAVQDTGHGISTHRRERIFSLFYSTKESSGFGLWSARRNAMRNYGDLKVESEPGHGSTFTLLLPEASEEENRPSTSPKKENGNV